MAYFSNGSEMQAAEEANCNRCAHEEDGEGNGCPALLLHLKWNYEAVGNPTKRQALDTLWPMTVDGRFPGRCSMFIEKKQPEETPLFPG